MMNALLHQITALGDAWTGWMWRACWQTAVVVAVAWCLTALLRRSSPTIRCWIWRIAYLKVAALLVWTTPVNLPLLPAGHGTMLSDAKPAVFDQASAAGDPMSGALAEESAALVPETVVREGADGVPAVSRKSEIAGLSRNDTNRLTWRSILLLAWAFGAVFVGLKIVLEARAAWRLLRGACHLDRSELETVLCDVCERLGLRHAPRLLASESAAAPILVQFIWPAIVLPRRLLETLSLGDIRLAIAHEVGHVRRHDVAWNAVATAVHCVLYFHPLLWLAHRRARFDQESACDELVLTHVDAGAQQYGQMLLNVVERVRLGLQPSVVAVGMTGTYKTLCRRIEAMKHIRKLTQKRILLAGCAVGILAILSIVPWRVIAQEHKPQEPTATEKQTASKENVSPEKLLVGTWRGGRSGSDELTLDELSLAGDGTYFWRGYQVERTHKPTLYAGAPGKDVPALRPSRPDSGKWSYEANLMILVSERFAPGLRGLPIELPIFDEGMFPNMTTKWQIVRLDQMLLRMKRATEKQESDGTILFFRRVEEDRTSKQLPASAPAELKRIAELARLSPAEALALLDWFSKPESEKLPWNVIERTARARNGELDFAGLFSLSPDEAVACADLLELVRSCDRAYELADRAQLASNELAAVNKIKGFRADLRRVGVAVYNEPIPFENNRVPNDPTLLGATPTVAPMGTPAGDAAFDNLKSAAFEKLRLLVDNLSGWLESTIR